MELKGEGRRSRMYALASTWTVQFTHLAQILCPVPSLDRLREKEEKTRENRLSLSTLQEMRQKTRVLSKVEGEGEVLLSHVTRGALFSHHLPLCL